jgi:hypothetical protein
MAARRAVRLRDRAIALPMTAAIVLIGVLESRA